MHVILSDGTSTELISRRAVLDNCLDPRLPSLVNMVQCQFGFSNAAFWGEDCPQGKW